MKTPKQIALTVVVAMLLTCSLIGVGQTSSKASSTTTVVGYISDSSCGLKHMEGMSDEKSCTLMCVKGGGSFVLADRDHKKVYKLDKGGQDKASAFAGQKVKVTGRITGKTIRVTTIEPVS